MKKIFFYVALASLTLTTSCSQDDLQSGRTSENEIQFHATMGLKSRATETTISNLNTFYVTAFKTDKDNYMQDVIYTSTGTDPNKTWSHEGTDTYFWPAEGSLNFYAYAPKTPGQAGTLSINKDGQTLSGFQPISKPKDQEDFIYATTTGNKSNSSDGISLNFNHALSQISVKAMNTNKAYEVKVTGVKIGGVKDQGTFTFPSADGTTTTAGWSDCSTTTGDGAIKGIYEISGSSESVALGETASDMNTIGNTPFMLIPQTLTKNDTKYASGAYIALQVKITMKSGVDADANNVYEGQVVHDGWAFVGIGETWDMGKHYTYTLDFSEGAGQDEEGNQIISGKEISYDVDVTEWNNETIKVFPDIATTPTEANCLIMNSPGKVYAINIASKINAFWTSEAAGTAKTTAPIADDTEWTAEVIWQDITNYVKAEKPSDYAQKRAIDFYDLSKGTQTTDTYTGKGKTLYIQLRNAYRGNIVVGVKKNDTEGYLWSWHLWLTEDPKEICGFMDRNLGATQPFPTLANVTAVDKNEAFGVWYQYGRKDALSHDIHYYDINGDLIGKWEEKTADGYFPYKEAQASSIAVTVKSPLQFYIGTGGNWLADESYKDNHWNDINGINSGTTKTFFDPSPDGWRLPTNDELGVLNDDDNFVYSSTYNGRIYKGLVLFPEPGYLQAKGVHENTLLSPNDDGFIWSVEPRYDGTELSEESKPADYKGAGFFIWKNESKGLNNTNRADGVQVRCVRDN